MAATDQVPRILGQKRDQLGSRDAHRLRQSGRLPAVIYGHKQDPIHVSVDQGAIIDLLHQHAHLLEVEVDAHREPCLIKDVQWDYLGSHIIHLDFARVDLTERVTVDVDLEYVGQPVGLKESGTYLEHPASTVQVHCVASQIPDSIKVIIDHLDVGQSLSVADLDLPDGVTAADDPDMILVAVHKASAVEEPEALSETSESSEPEIIRKKERDKEDS